VTFSLYLENCIMILVFDTETTGLPARDKAMDHPDQPWPIQIAAALVNVQNDFEIIATMSTLVKPGAPCEYNERAIETHGKSPELVEAKGVSVDTAYDLFMGLVAQADVLAAYNFPFDFKIMESARLRTNPKRVFFPSGVTQLCLMRAAQKRLGFQPKLVAAYARLTGKEPINAHDAMGDVQMTVEVLKALAAPAT
jgi:DNA polymerase III epsilon subunit-like protein